MRAGVRRSLSDCVVLTVAEMRATDEAAIAAGVSGLVLMRRAGRAVALEIMARWSPRPTVVICGPGANGGDGYVVAAQLLAEGWPVVVAAVRPPSAGDAALAAGDWRGETLALSPAALRDAELIIDALFGAGLSDRWTRRPGMCFGRPSARRRWWRSTFRPASRGTPDKPWDTPPMRR